MAILPTLTQRQLVLSRTEPWRQSDSTRLHTEHSLPLKGKQLWQLQVLGFSLPPFWHCDCFMLQTLQRSLAPGTVQFEHLHTVVFSLPSPLQSLPSKPHSEQKSPLKGGLHAHLQVAVFKTPPFWQRVGSRLQVLQT